MRSTFKVLFYLKRNAPKKNGLIPVMCRITVKRQNHPIQLQMGRGGEIVERGVRPCFRSQHRGAGGQPDVG